MLVLNDDDSEFRLLTLVLVAERVYVAENTFKSTIIPEQVVSDGSARITLSTY